MSGCPEIVVLPGDGIGPEVTRSAIRVLDRLGEFTYDERLIGGAAIDATGEPVSDETVEACRTADAVLFGAAGGPQWENGGPRAEMGLMRLRQDLDLFANLRPVRPFPETIGASPLRPERLEGVNLLIVRELTGGIYFGRRELGPERAFDTCEYETDDIERVLKVAFESASSGVTSVDKANVLDTSRLWRSVAERVGAEEYPDIPLRHLLVDNAAMQLVDNPLEFDVLVTENMFGDILSDLAAVLSGSIGLLPSASMSEAGGPALFEPIHGSAPDIAGKGIANPMATMLSAAMMLRLKLDRPDEAQAIEQAVAGVLRDGVRSADLGGDSSTDEITDAVLARIP